MTQETPEVFLAPNGFDCDVAFHRGGWTAFYVSTPSVDFDHLEELGRYKVSFRHGSSEKNWRDAFISQKREMHMVGSTDEGIKEAHLASGERMTAPSLVIRDGLYAVWGQRSGGIWELQLWNKGSISTLYQTRNVIRRPRLAADSSETLWVAWEETTPDGHMVSLMSQEEAPKTRWSSPGTGINISSGSGGAVWLLWECPSKEGTQLKLWNVKEDGAPSVVPSNGTMNINPDLTVDGEGNVLMVWESSLAWGRDQRAGLNRRIEGCIYDPRPDEFRRIQGTEEGYLPIPDLAFKDFSVQNIVPIHPKIANSSSGIICTFRMFHPRGIKSFGWDICKIHRHDGKWVQPTVISQGPGYPDSAYGVSLKGDRLLLASHRCDHKPQLTYEEQDRGEEARDTQRAVNHRISVINRPAFESKGQEAPVLERGQAQYVPDLDVPDPIAGPGKGIPDTGYQLIWGDIHVHSTASKCMSANDGTPMDNIRWQRDVMDSQVLTLTEHVEYMSGQEYTRNADLLEGEACEDRAILYGLEWAKSPAHHTNFFCISRVVYDHLRTILLSENHLSEVFDRVKKELPPQSVCAIRHFHGENADQFGVSGPRVTETFDGEVEWAMEAVQSRIDAMTGDNGRRLPRFPANFLQQGAKIGLVGGSDHCRDSRRRFCFTGFWVDEISPRGVFKALRERRTTATASGRIALWLETEGGEVEMGSEGRTTSPVVLRIKYSAESPLKSLQIWKDGEFIDLDTPEESSGTVKFVDPDSEGQHCYLARATSSSHFPKINVLAYSSPIWIKVER